MTKTNQSKTEKRFVSEIASLLISLKSQIDDDFRASDDRYDNTPGMQVTVSTNDNMQSWNYQTGDNSFSGGCYGDSHWSVIYLYRRSNCRELATDAVNELSDAIAESKASKSLIPSNEVLNAWNQIDWKG